MDLRDQWMQHMVANNPAAAPYAKAWGQRNADLRQIIGGQGGSAAPATSGPNSPGFHALGAATVPAPMTQADRAKWGISPQDPNSYALGADGKPFKTADAPYDAAWDRGQRDSFTGWEPVKQWQAIAKPSYDALVKNIGQMSGPAAYAILDTAIRTDNPGATTRQAQLDSFEHKFGPISGLMGTLLNYQGKGTIPLDVQQKILNSAAPFAQAHWDAANSLYHAQSDLAQSHGRNPADVTTPIGPRPLGVTVTPKGPVFNVTSPADVHGLPSGTTFKTPDGRLKRVP
jgi:hypothetical protein